MKKFDFPCGCSFPIDESRPRVNGQGAIVLDIENVPMNCKATWDLISSGMTKGVFQLESSLGKTWAKKLQPDNLNHLAALVALLRPGCIAGDTKVAVGLYDSDKRKINLHKLTMRQLYEKWERDHIKFDKKIISLNTDDNLFFENAIEDVVFSGVKEVYRPNFRTRLSRQPSGEFYKLDCTLDHLILTHDRGWVELQNLELGERIAVTRLKRTTKREVVNAPGEKSFRNQCLFQYKYKCIFCDWNEGSLDVNHIEGNRKSNNNPNNLCFMCPNHHRVFSEGGHSKAQVLQARKQYELRNSEHIQWVEYAGKEFVGTTDTYDITVAGPYHNFLAGNVVVHNCLKAKDADGISMTDRYVRRKLGVEDTEYYIPELESILGDTYGVLVYQEQAMAIACKLAGFDLREADMLRKAIGKKDTETMAKTKKLFMEKSKAAGIITEEQAEFIFGNIQKSQRYSFNKSHAVGYGLTGYHTAYMKAHFPLQFYTSYLFYAKEKQNPAMEIKELINDAKHFNIKVMPPRFAEVRPHFNTNGVVITFGLSDIKGIGEGQILNMRPAIVEAEKFMNKSRFEWSWYDFLVYMSSNIKSDVVTKMIESGALAYEKLDRQLMLSEYNAWRDLNDRERNNISSKFAPTAKEEAKLLKEGREIALHEFTNLKDAIEHLLVHPKGVFNASRRKKVESILALLKKPPRSVVDSPDWISRTEQQNLGISLTCNLTDRGDTSLVNMTCREFREGKGNDSYVVLGVTVEDMREFAVKTGPNAGKMMAFVTVSDESGMLDDVTFFSDAWEKFSNDVFPGSPIMLQGKRDIVRGSLLVENIWRI